MAVDRGLRLAPPGRSAITSLHHRRQPKPAQAVAHLAERNTVGEPSVLPFAPDLIEAYIRVGDLDSARPLLAAFAARADELQRGWALAAAARCAGLLAGEGEVDVRFREAIELGGDPCGLGDIAFQQ